MFKGFPQQVQSNSAEGLDIQFGHKRHKFDKCSEHKGFRLFDTGHSVYHGLYRLFTGAPNRDAILNAVGYKLKRRQYSNEEHEIYRTIDSVTLEEAMMRR